MYIDLEESIGTIDTTRAAYDRMIELKVASTQTILNYAELLREHNYFEESFKVYEQGIELFVNSKQNYEIEECKGPTLYLAKFTLPGFLASAHS